MLQKIENAEVEVQVDIWLNTFQKTSQTLRRIKKQFHFKLVCQLRIDDAGYPCYGLKYLLFWPI
jgi:hypothetical protein